MNAISHSTHNQLPFLFSLRVIIRSQLVVAFKSELLTYELVTSALVFVATSPPERDTLLTTRLRTTQRNEAHVADSCGCSVGSRWCASRAGFLMIRCGYMAGRARSSRRTAASAHTSAIHSPRLSVAVLLLSAVPKSRFVKDIDADAIEKVSLQ